jgi:hypothetical protein
MSSFPKWLATERHGAAIAHVDLEAVVDAST